MKKRIVFVIIYVRIQSMFELYQKLQQNNSIHSKVFNQIKLISTQKLQINRSMRTSNSRFLDTSTNMSLSFRQNSFPYQRQNHYKTGLGNTTPRYNSEVKTQRKKYYINSTRNSEDAPEWMSRTQQYFLKAANMQRRNSSLYVNPEGQFMQTKQKWVYESTPKANNVSGQFDTVRNKKARSMWEMKDHTYRFEWPQKQITMQLKESRPRGLSESRTRIDPFFKYEMPKYAIKQSPLHRQRQTVIKIGHSTRIDSVYVK